MVRVKDLGRRNLLGVLVDAVDRDAAVTRGVLAARQQRPYAVTALAVHGVVTGVEQPVHRYRLNQFDLVTPDGQPVRWALTIVNLRYVIGLCLQLTGLARPDPTALEPPVSEILYG